MGILKLYRIKIRYILLVLIPLIFLFEMLKSICSLQYNFLVILLSILTYSFVFVIYGINGICINREGIKERILHRTKVIKWNEITQINIERKNFAKYLIKIHSHNQIIEISNLIDKEKEIISTIFDQIDNKKLDIEIAEEIKI